jgi:ABC-2 type transport system permease protein
MMGFRVLLAKELREQLRTGRIVAVAAVFILFGILGPLTDRYMKELLDALGGQASSGFQVTVPPPSLAGSLNQILKNLSQFGVICALLLAMGSVAWEKERGTAGMIMTKPASRAAFLTAKLVAMSLNLGIGVVLGTGLGYVYTLVLYPTVFPLGGYVAMAAILWWSMVTFVALTMLASTISRSAAAAAGVGLVALLVLGLLVEIPVVGPWSPLALLTPAAHLGLGEDAGNFMGPLLFNVALVPALVGLCWVWFRRQEL